MSKLGAFLEVFAELRQIVLEHHEFRTKNAELTAENGRLREALRQFPTLPPLYETKSSGVIVQTEESKDPAESLDERCHDFFSDALIWKGKYLDPALSPDVPESEAE